MDDERLDEIEARLSVLETAVAAIIALSSHNIRTPIVDGLDSPTEPPDDPDLHEFAALVDEARQKLAGDIRAIRDDDE